MDYKDLNLNWKSPLVTRVSILVVTILIFSYTIFGPGDFSWLIMFIVLGAIIFQVAQLIKAVEKSNENISSFLGAISFDDLSLTFKTDSTDPSVQALHAQLNEAISKLRNTRKERDSEYQFFKNIVQHVGISLPRQRWFTGIVRSGACYAPSLKAVMAKGRSPRRIF